MNIYSKVVNTSIKNILADLLNGKYPLKYTSINEKNLFGDGVSILLGENRVVSRTPQERKIVTLTPRASVLIKKKAFSTFKQVNDLQWLDRTEKMLLRATKSLFAFKVAQIRAYESLTKVESFFKDTGEISLSLFIDLLENSKYLDVDSNLNLNIKNEFLNIVAKNFQQIGYDEIKEDILKIMERNAFASELELTTWIVDPNSTDNYETGPGTGVIEIGIYSAFQTQTNIETNPSMASFTMSDPYRVMNITEADIELAIQEALVGTVGLLNDLSNPSAPPIDTRSIVGAGMNLLGLGFLDPSIDVDYIRDRLRVFYLGKPFINPGDGVHFFIRGNKTSQDFSASENLFDRGFFSIDESIMEAERLLFTNKKVDLETYKNLRQFADNSFGMKHVFGGFVVKVGENFSNGKWVMSVDCTDNMSWLTWSRFMIQPALQDPSGILEDPLTPYELKTDGLGAVLSAGGPQLLEENKYLIKSGLLFYDSGILNGQVATENNLLQGQFNKSGSLSGAKIFQHPQGLIYRWKSGIITATAGVSVVDPLNEKDITQQLHNQTYGLNVAQDVLNNLDLANIISILVVGQPYNVETFVNQAYQVHNISKQNGSLSAADPLSAVLDVVRRNNNHFGNFKPYRMITMSSQTLLQTANSNILRNNTNSNISKLQERRAKLASLISKLSGSQNKLLSNSLEFELRSINDGIQEQVKILNQSGSVSAVDLITENFNLFGQNKTLPLSGNYSADHQLTRSMNFVATQRKIEDVRLNRDQNLLIVSDQYDEQTDIRPFIFKLKDSNYKIFQGNFVSIYDKCAEAASFINLEFFCNPNGHLEFRPPQWNKTPLSILQRLFQINSEEKRKIIPDFLTEVFQTRSTSLRREVHAMNIRIVILSLLLNKYPDKEIIPNFNVSVSNNILLSGSSSGKESLRFFGVSEAGIDGDLSLRRGNFQFSVGNIINTGTQTFGEGFSLNTALSEDGDILNGDTETLLGQFDPIFQEQTGLASNLLTTAISSGNKTPIKIANPANINKLRKDFIKLSGADPVSDLVSSTGEFQSSDFIYGFSTNNDSEVNNINKINNYLEKLKQTISNRDNLVTILQRNVEKEKELDEVNDILNNELGTVPQFRDRTLNDIVEVLDNASNTIKTISDIFTGDITKGTLFDHLIADDSRNLTGPGSGKRFIIHDEDIISCSFSEEPPNFCRVDIVGDSPVIGAINTSFDDRYFWAGATDFDLWRQYGYKHSSTVSLPFSNDAELQSKPYAIFSLQNEKVRINQGQITVVGNEYYEPGDCVYIECKELLYYVRTVNHSFDIGGSFTTTLILEFGHPPGTYLPTPLDVIGQQYTKDPFFGNILSYRNSLGDDNYRVLQPDSSIVFPTGREISPENVATLLDHKDNAVRFTNMMADLSSLLIGERIIMIRGFVKSKTDEDIDFVKNNIDVIKYLLQNPVMLSQSKNGMALDDDALFNLGDVTDSVTGKVGLQSGSAINTVPMTLPNGLPIISIKDDQIIEQIVYLEKDGSTSEIQYLDSKLLTAQIIDNKNIDSDKYKTIFPQGGPKQRTWLDIRNAEGSIFSETTFKVSNVIEIGILDINKSIKSDLLKK